MGTEPTQPKYYQCYKNYLKASFWRNVTKMGDIDVSASKGLAIWDTHGTNGPGLISEATSYAMILAALYNDKDTFDRLSATIQAGIAFADSKRNKKTGLFPWYWKPTGHSLTEYSYEDINSASDADINIALAYVYADIATTVYEWKDGSTTYNALAKAHINAIRTNDFSTNDTEANNHILADGYAQAGGTSFDGNLWHPDYSDLRVCPGRSDGIAEFSEHEAD
jgi:endo-1,4-beta-D-glucanase Y